MSRYQAPPAQIMQQRPGPLGMAANFAINRGLQAGLDAYAPGAGTFGGDLARELAPALVPRFNEGGHAKKPAWYMNAQLRAEEREGKISEKEKEALYREGGGKLGTWLGFGPTAEIYAQLARDAGSAVSDRIPSKAQAAAALGLDPESREMAKEFWKSPWATTKSAMGYNHGGQVAPMMSHPTHKMGVAEYKNAGGRCGPLAKTVMKDKDGNSSERHYHNPLAGGPAKKEG